MRENYFELYEKYKALYNETLKQFKVLFIDYNLLVKKFNELKKSKEVDNVRRKSNC